MRILWFTVFIGLAACHKEKPPQSVMEEKVFLKGEALGVIDPELEEASGLIESIVNPGMLWSHNDSGNSAEVFLIDKSAKIKMTCILKGIKNRDWEDITIGPGPEESKTYIYVGDIGDNNADYETKLIYRFEEPIFDEAKKLIIDFDTLTINLSDGARDMEAITIDPLSKILFLVSKREDSVHLYQIPYPFNASSYTAQKVATLPFYRIAAIDISPDGSEVLMKDYDYIYYWKRSSDQSIIDLLQQRPIKLAYKREEQGESICFARDNSGYYTLSESVDKEAELMFYKRK